MGARRTKPKKVGLKRRLRRVFEIDPRSLGLFRICFGLSVVVDLIQQVSILEEMTTDAGSLPRELHRQLYSSLERWSLHLLGGSWQFEASLYALTFIVLGAFIAGYRTRWATLILWVLLTSLHNRHPMFNTASDSVRRLLLFWGFFLPLGCRFSLDRRAGRDHTPDKRIFSVASVAILAQVVFIYLGAGFAKDYETWVRKGTATIMALRLDYFATRFGKALLEYPSVLKATSIYTWWLECVMPFVALAPFNNARLRLVAIVGFVSLHLGLYLCMVLGAFPFLMMAAWMLFLPPLFWSWLGRVPGRPDLAGRIASRFEALLERVKTALPAAAVSGSTNTRSWINRTPGHAIVSVSFAFVVVWNLQTIGPRVYSEFPRLLRNESIIAMLRVFRLTQSWEVFSPHPSSRDGWLMVVATLRDGTKVDLFRHGRPVDWTKPEHVADVYENTRWTKYSDNLVSRAGRPHRRPYVEMHVRRWNARQPESRHVAHVELVYMVERTLPDLTEAPLKKDVIWEGSFQ